MEKRRKRISVDECARRKRNRMGQGSIKVKYSIDEILNMLSANNDKDIQLLGIKEASKIKHLSVLIMPYEDKSSWDNCARIISDKTDEELKFYIIFLLEWIKDINWPGAELIYQRLKRIPYEKISIYLDISEKLAKESNDTPWMRSLHALRNEYFDQRN